MPVYLVHGFRWPRPLIRIHVILKNIDDAAPEWLVAPGSHNAVIENFRQLYPTHMSNLPNLRFIEQYDPLDETVKSQPYAYVTDMVHQVELSADIDSFRDEPMESEKVKALAGLRDELCPDAKIGWYVVVCGDEERWAPSVDLDTPPETLFHDSALEKRYISGDLQQGNWSASQSNKSKDARETQTAGNDVRPPMHRSRSLSRRFKNLFTLETKRSKSMRNLRNPGGSSRPASSEDHPPPLPATAQ